ncbi:MAG: HD domain-containing phosphohydrolase [bacterium]
MPYKILYVEDNLENKKLVRRILEANHYIVAEADDGLSAIRIAQEEKPDLVLMDIGIPGMNGYEATTLIKAIPELRQTPVVALTARVMDGDRERSLAAGCDGYISKPIDVRSFPDLILSFLNGKREYVSATDEPYYLKEYSQKLVQQLEKNILELRDKNLKLEKHTQEMQEICLNVISSLTRAIEEKDPYTAGHSERVTRYALRIAEKMKLPEDDIQILKRSAMLHDIGKLVIDLACLNKEEPLTTEEWTRISLHPGIAASILSPIKFLEREVEIIRHHSERWDGKGYPDGLKEEEIDGLTRILILADSFDAMTSDRCYKKKKSIEEAVEEIKKCRGTHFDPMVADIFINILKKEKDIFAGWIRESMDEADLPLSV